jgi:hypothetical protein
LSQDKASEAETIIKELTGEHLPELRRTRPINGKGSQDNFKCNEKKATPGTVFKLQG